MENNLKPHANGMFGAVIVMIVLSLLGTYLNSLAAIIGIPILLILWYLYEFLLTMSDLQEYRQIDFTYGVIAATLTLIPFTFIVGVILNIIACNLIKMPKNKLMTSKVEQLQTPRVQDIVEIKIRINKRYYIHNIDRSNIGASINKIIYKTSTNKNITDLGLSGTSLEKMPSEVLLLENLTKLDISNNFLDSLPVEILDMKSLEYLKLDGNEFTSLPEGIENMPNLSKESAISIAKIRSELTNI